MGDAEHGTGRPDARTGPGGVAAGQGVRRGPEALQQFRRDLDAVLDQLRTSAARPTAVAALDIPRIAVSGTATPFAEADGLHRQYARVHRQLVDSATVLSEHVEALGIAVRGVDIGFDHLEQDLRDRFRRIRAHPDGPPAGSTPPGGPRP